jgi:sialidase-1
MLKSLRKSLVFLLFTLLCNIVIAQKHIIRIPDNDKIVTVHDWLVANPLPSKYYPNGMKENGLQDGFSMDFLSSIGGEKSPKIVTGKTFNTHDGKKGSFVEHTWATNYINLTDLFGNPADVFTYLYAELESNVDQDIYLHIGSNDASKVWINGDIVIEYPTGRSAEPSQDIARVNLRAGKNTILLKVDQYGGEWGAYVQIYSLTEQKAFDSIKEKMLINSSKISTIFETKVICKQPNKYIGWPTITKTSSGELLTVFSGNRDGHVCPYGIDQIISSKDNGETWSEPKTINNTPLDDRDAGILETKSGTWLVSWFTSLAFDNERSYSRNPEWRRHREKINEETVEKWLGNWTRRSLDKGKTWEEPVKQLVTAPHGPIELNDGRLLYVGTTTINEEYCLAVEESKDDGISWQLLSKIDIPENESITPYSEPHVVEMSDGKLLAMFRYHPSDRSKSFLRQTESYDGGKTWSVTHKTNIWGFPPHLLLLKNGWIVLSYGVRKIPYGERACISKDGGESWDIDNEILISMSDTEDLGYPSSIQLDDGSIITIYYQIDKKGEKTSLMQTHWKLNDLK